MRTTLVIRSATAADAPAVASLLRDLGYPAERDRVVATLCRLLDDPGAFVIDAADEGRVSSACCRFPVVRFSDCKA